MKKSKNNQNNEPATKGDIKRLEKRFDGLEGRFDRLEGKFEGLEKRIDKFEIVTTTGIRRLDKKIDDFEHRLNDRFDEVIKEVRESRDDRKIMESQISEHDERLDNHEVRIKKLEDKTRHIATS